MALTKDGIYYSNMEPDDDGDWNEWNWHNFCVYSFLEQNSIRLPSLCLWCILDKYTIYERKMNKYLIELLVFQFHVYLNFFPFFFFSEVFRSRFITTFTLTFIIDNTIYLKILSLIIWHINMNNKLLSFFCIIIPSCSIFFTIISQKRSSRAEGGIDAHEK